MDEWIKKMWGVCVCVKIKIKIKPKKKKRPPQQSLHCSLDLLMAFEQMNEWMN